MRYRGVLLIDAVLFVLAYFGAWVLRFDGIPGPLWMPVLLRTLPAVVVIQGAIFVLFRVHRHLWHYVSVADLMRIVAATATSAIAEAAFVAYPLQQYGPGFPRSVVVINAALVVLLCGGARLAFRMNFQRMRAGTSAPKRVAIVGAGGAADAVLREMLHRAEFGYRPVFLVEDDPTKIGGTMHGCRIYGPLTELPRLAERFGVAEVIIAIPSATRAEMHRILEIVGETGLPSKTVPALGDLINGTISVSRLRRVEISDLLNRDQVRTDLESVASYLQGRRVLVTGAGGAIGTELCRQVLEMGPELMVLLGRGENSLYEVRRKLREEYPEANPAILQGDVVNRPKLEHVMQRHRPDVVFHAAANKHVPLSEINVDETLLCNVIGTWNVLETSALYGVKRVVCISTDKAVDPRGVMGASKRLAEMLVLQASYPNTICTSVRFGNVLGSRASVVPLFQEQIAKGQPVTITDAEMTRYFMTISEAAQLVLQAGAFSEGGDLFVLDMGEPLRILDLARQMIRLSGLRPDEDVPIKVIGRRPGEKLHEALLSEGESFEPTPHPKIRRIRCVPPPVGASDIEELRQLCIAADVDCLRTWIARHIPTFGQSRSEPAPRARSSADDGHSRPA